ncbi:MAG: tetratricopeptide repeat protein [Bacteroidetes bacterium]|nr:tetratricopeptide repeat protein [Bacteroidota bacterium]
MSKKIFFLLAIFLNQLTYAAELSKTDSLRLELKTVKGNKRVDVINKLIKNIYKDDIKEAKKLLSEAEKLSADYPQGKVTILLNKGRIVLQEEKDANKSLSYFEEGLKLGESINYVDGVSAIYSAIVRVKRDQGDMKGCEESLNKGYLFAEKNKNTEMKANLLNLHGTMEYFKGNLPNALEYFKKSLAEYKKINIKDQIAGLTMNIGIMYYRQGAAKESLDYYEKALKVMREIKDSLNIANALQNIAITESQLGNETKAIEDYKEAILILKLLKENLALSGCLDNLGASLSNIGKKSEALKCFLDGIKIKEQEKDGRGLAYSYVNLASVYQELRDTLKSFKYYYKAKEMCLNIGDEYRYGHTLNGLGVLHSETRRYDSAKFYMDEALKIAIKLNDIPGQGTSLLSIGNNYKRQRDNTNAVKYYKEALTIKEKIGDKVSVAGLLNNIGVIYYDAKNYREAVNYYERALKMRKEANNMLGISDSYLSMANAYSELRDYKNAYQYEVLYHKTWDSLYNADITQQIAEMNTKYETAKKDKEIAERKASEKIANEKAEKESLERKNAENKFLFAILGITLLLVLAGYVIYGNIQRKKANLLLANQNKEINEQKNEIEKQKHLVEEKQKEIIDSISYAKRLQEAILPPVEFINHHIPNSFILYKPKDIVAGDFYWADVAEDCFYIAAADCTGHGVPGALVSVVCSNALNRAVKEFNLRKPGEILDKTRLLVIETFEKSQNNVKDGMDISLLCIDKKNKKVSWSGANNPLWYIQNNELNEIKATKQPIGMIDNPQRFATHELALTSDTIFYLITDGYADQFGGTNGKKFKYKQLQELMLSSYHHPTKQQAEILSEAFNSWKGNLEQVDDVCIIGIHI